MIDVIGTSTSPARRLTLTRSKWRASRSGTLRGAKLAKQDIHVGDGGDFIYPRRSAFKYEQDLVDRQERSAARDHARRAHRRRSLVSLRVWTPMATSRSRWRASTLLEEENHDRGSIDQC